MNIEKVKEALELALREHNDFMSQADLPIGSKKIEEALAELEKPAEDDVLTIASRWVLSSRDLAPLAYDIQEYAESYHAKKCAECIGNLPAFPHRPSRFPESRSGITTDVDK